MLRESYLVEVWCEPEDDVTLLWDFGQGVVVEFVQVKAAELQQLWSVALLCSGGAAGSIVAKSLAHDRCAEPCWFRVVTRSGIQSDLHPLRLDRENSGRCLGDTTTRALHEKVSRSMGDALSPRGRTASHWLADAIWEVGESEQAMANHNRWQLQEYLEQSDEPLFTDQLRELYDQLLFRVHQASFPKWKDGADKKKLRRDGLRSWLLGTVRRIRGYAPTMAGTNLKRKMEDALIPASAIDTADRMRRAYRTRMLDARYQQDEDLKAAELEVAAVLQYLLSHLDAGNISDDGRQFHARCLDALLSVHQTHPRADISFLQGALYSATDRCRHRFLRAMP
jgi:hypothetical protein